MSKYGIKLHVWGDLACFTRPELKSERMSYEVITPSAARGILTAIYWKPEFNWVIDRVQVLKPIRFMQVRRNELGNKAVVPSKAVMEGTKTGKVGCYIEDNRQQRAATVLRDVAYVIEAHVEIVKEDESGCNSVAKHLEIFKRRAIGGQCFHQPCLGTREFMAHFELVDDDNPPVNELPYEQANRSLGLMLHDMIYSDVPKAQKKGVILVVDHDKTTAEKRAYKNIQASPRYFMAELKDGTMHVPPLSKTLS